MTRLDEGRTVYVRTYVRVWPVKPKHRAMIRLTKGGRVEMQSGRQWLDIRYCSFAAGDPS